MAKQDTQLQSVLPQKTEILILRRAIGTIVMSADFEYFIGIAGFWNGIPSLFRYRPVTDFYGIPAER